MLVPDSSPKIVPVTAPRGEHVVQFYESEEFLYGAVADYLAGGIAAGEPVIVIATEPHRHGFCERLQAKEIDVAAARACGRLVLLDAHETLSSISVDGEPEWELFRTRIGGLIEQKLRESGAARVRAFGEMVDLLWREGKQRQAIHLEGMWADLRRLQQFTLLCAYVMGNFFKEADGAHFDEICRIHTQVVPAESLEKKDDSDQRLRDIGSLQQRALSLEHEVAQRKELENALRDALAERRRIEAELRNAQDQLRRQNEELARAVRFSEMFVGILGHDLRNPLSAIMTGAGLLARRADADKVAKPAQRILKAAERMRRMIDQILDFSRIRLGHGLPLQRRHIDLAEVCRLVIDETESSDGHQPVRLEEVGDALGVWDGDRLSQLVSNLLANALAHGTPDRPVAIRLDGTDAQEIKLEVHNAGAISAEVLPVLFDGFRTANRKQERSSGLGLGLFITQQIVLAHGGSIAVTSTAEDGTRFLVRLPRNAPLGTTSFVADKTS